MADPLRCNRFRRCPDTALQRLDTGELDHAKDSRKLPFRSVRGTVPGKPWLLWSGHMPVTTPRTRYRLPERLSLRLSRRDLSELQAIAAAAEAPPATVARHLLSQAIEQATTVT